MQYLLRNKISYLVISLCISSAAIAQRDQVFRPNQDQLPYYFGISFGLVTHYTSYNFDGRFLSTSASLQDPKSIIQISPMNTTFFNLGLVGTKKITNNIYIRANPNFLISGNKSFNFNIKETPNDKQKFSTQPSIIQLPIAIKFQSDRYNGFRFANFMQHYLIFGGKFDFDLASSRPGKISPKGNFSSTDYPGGAFKGTDMGAEIGVGLSFYLRYATISPEVKFSYGLTINKKNNLLFSIIDKIKTNFVFFTILVEN